MIHGTTAPSFLSIQKTFGALASTLGKHFKQKQKASNGFERSLCGTWLDVHNIKATLATSASLVQAILWQVVDAKLLSLRKQFSADVAAFWNARTIYQAQLEAHQVFCMPCDITWMRVCETTGPTVLKIDLFVSEPFATSFLLQASSCIVLCNACVTLCLHAAASCCACMQSVVLWCAELCCSIPIYNHIVLCYACMQLSCANCLLTRSCGTLCSHALCNKMAHSITSCISVVW